jgi:hypothetical protein
MVDLENMAMPSARRTSAKAASLESTVIHLCISVVAEIRLQDPADNPAKTHERMPVLLT